MTPLDSFEIVVDQHMAGMKKAVKMGNKIVVSPAMYDLIKHADQKELEHLLKNIPLIDIPEK